MAKEESLCYLEVRWEARIRSSSGVGDSHAMKVLGISLPPFSECTIKGLFMREGRCGKVKVSEKRWCFQKALARYTMTGESGSRWARRRSPGTTVHLAIGHSVDSGDRRFFS